MLRPIPGEMERSIIVLWKNHWVYVCLRVWWGGQILCIVRNANRYRNRSSTLPSTPAHHPLTSTAATGCEMNICLRTLIYIFNMGPFRDEWRDQLAGSKWNKKWLGPWSANLDRKSEQLGILRNRGQSVLPIAHTLKMYLQIAPRVEKINFHTIMIMRGKLELLHLDGQQKYIRSNC